QAVNCLLQSVEPFQAAASVEFHDAVFGKANPRKKSLAEERANLSGQIARLRLTIEAAGLQPAQKKVVSDYAIEAENFAKDTAEVQMAGEQLAGTASGVARN